MIFGTFSLLLDNVFLGKTKGKPFLQVMAGVYVIHGFSCLIRCNSLGKHALFETALLPVLVRRITRCQKQKTRPAGQKAGG